MLEIKQVENSVWGNCLRMANSTNELLITLDFGPRIISFAPLGEENMFFEDVNDLSNTADIPDEMAAMYGVDKGVWHIRGGHRLWTSPEKKPRTYYPDNQPVKYEKIENGVLVTPPFQVANNIQMSMEITMPEENCVHIVHHIKNIGNWDVELAPWALTVLAPGGTEIFPLPDKETGLLENRHIVLWPYTKMTDKRVTWGDKFITLKQDPNADCAFKLGQLSQHGWAAYFNKGNVFVKYFDVTEEKNHPDRNCNFETYTSNLMLEMESVGSFEKIAPGETVSHSECWCTYKNVSIPETEEECADFAKKYVED